MSISVLQKGVGFHSVVRPGAPPRGAGVLSQAGSIMAARNTMHLNWGVADTWKFKHTVHHHHHRLHPHLKYVKTIL